MATKEELTRLHNTPFALLVWYLRPGEEDQAQAFKGLASWNSATRAVDFRRGLNEPVQLVFTSDDFDRIQQVDAEMKDILPDCAYGIPLTMEDLPENADPELYRKTGITWPE